MAGKLRDRIQEVLEKPKLGLMTNPWGGNVDAKNGPSIFDGPFLRLNSFGSVRTVPSKGKMRPFEDGKAHFLDN
jgi:hypothetical protein